MTASAPIDTALRRSLEGKVVLVTGVGPNIGTEIAQRFAECGAVVACNDLSQEAADATVARVQEQGGEAFAVVGDVSDPDSVQRMVGEVLARSDRIDVLVNNAAITVPKGLLDSTYEEFCKVTDIILNGIFLMSQAVAKAMVERGTPGAIVNIASTSGHRGRRNAVAYCAAKGRVLNMTRAMACDLAPHGIRVNSVSPTKTGASVGALESAKGRDVSEIPLGRAGEPVDQARAVVFMASELAGFVTGEDLRVDGGSLATWGTRSHASLQAAGSP